MQFRSMWTDRKRDSHDADSSCGYWTLAHAASGSLRFFANRREGVSGDTKRVAPRPSDYRFYIATKGTSQRVMAD